MNKIYIFLADGFEEIEALTVVDLCRRAKIDCTMVSVSEASKVTGSHGICVAADMLFEKEALTDADMLVLPGGMPGTLNLGSHKELAELLVSFHKAGKYLAAICAAPSVFGGLGILDGRKATCYPGFEDKLTGADISGEKVVMDGNVITSRGFGTAIDFALKIISVLVNEEMADELARGIQYR